MKKENLRILFIINPGSGNDDTDWPVLIREYFTPLDHSIELFELPEKCDPRSIKEKIEHFAPQQVVAVGGDGTVKLVGECLLQKNIPLGILPGGSANGLAKELGISVDPMEALDVLVNGKVRSIHVVKINEHFCFHLSDIGFNAYVIKLFEQEEGRGMWGYIKASFKVLWKHPVMTVEMQLNNEMVKIKCAMIVIANATRYGSGVVINPLGKLDDDVFEVIAVKKVSFREIFKMRFTHAAYDPEKTVLFQTNNLKMHSVKKAHFQVDGEYLGKLNEVKASLIASALQVIVPVPAT